MDILNLFINLLAVVGGYVVTVTVLFVLKKVLQVLYLIVTVVLDALTLGKLKTAKPEQGQKQRQEQNNNQSQQKHNPQQQKQRDPQNQQQRRDPAQAQNPQREQKPQPQQQPQQAKQPQPKPKQNPNEFSLVGMVEQWERELANLPKE